MITTARSPAASCSMISSLAGTSSGRPLGRISSATRSACSGFTPSNLTTRASAMSHRPSCRKPRPYRGPAGDSTPGVALAQKRQHLAAEALDEAQLVGCRTVEHQVAEAEIDVLRDPLDLLLGIAGDDEP